jgi:hypothetical protein
MKPESEQEETNFEETHRDQYAGQGGSYEIGPDGKRRRIARTLTTEEAKAIEEAGSGPRSGGIAGGAAIKVGTPRVQPGKEQK